MRKTAAVPRPMSGREKFHSVSTVASRGYRTKWDGRISSSMLIIKSSNNAGCKQCERENYDLSVTRDEKEEATWRNNDRRKFLELR